MFTRDTTSYLFAPGLRMVMMNNFKMKPVIYNQIFHLIKTDRKYEQDYEMHGFTNVGEISEGENIPFQEVATGNLKTYTPLTYASGTKWTIEAEEDELYGYFRKIPGYITNATNYTIETIAATVLNNSFSVTGADGKYLFATDHPTKDSTQSNRPTSGVDIGLTALENSVVALNKQTNWELHPIDNMGSRILLIHPDEGPNAYKIVNTSDQPYSANNTVNYLFKKFKIIEWNYLSDTDAWFNLAEPWDGGLMFVWRKNPDIFTDKDPNNLAQRIMCRFRCVAGYTSYLKTYGSPGAA